MTNINDKSMIEASPLNDADALGAVRELLHGILGLPEGAVKAEHRLTHDLAMDSLELLDLVMAFEGRWGVRVDACQLRRMVTVADSAALLMSAAPRADVREEGRT